MKLEGEEYCNTELLSSSQLPSCCSPACVEYNRRMSSNEIVKNEGGLNCGCQKKAGLLNVKGVKCSTYI